MMGLKEELAKAAVANVAWQVGEGVREALASRREQRKPCRHGRPGGLLCAKCDAKEGE